MVIFAPGTLIVPTDPAGYGINAKNMARIDWTKFCKEIAGANGIELFNITYRKHGEIKTGTASKKQIEMFARFGIELISVNQ